jgi:hypothetical protein
MAKTRTAAKTSSTATPRKRTTAKKRAAKKPPMKMIRLNGASRIVIERTPPPPGGYRVGKRKGEPDILYPIEPTSIDPKILEEAVLWAIAQRKKREKG